MYVNVVIERKPTPLCCQSHEKCATKIYENYRRLVGYSRLAVWCNTARTTIQRWLSRLRSSPKWVLSTK